MALLEDFPKLESWYHSQDVPHLIPGGVQACTRSICYFLQQEALKTPSNVMRPIIDLLESGENPDQPFIELYSFLDSLGVSLDEIITHTVESAVFDDSAMVLYLTKLAGLTGHLPFHFLAAWLGFNQNNLELCLEQIEKIDPPTSASLTLQGQALLESGAVEESIHILRAATRRDPNEILAFFQLAKAEHIQGHSLEAWQALESCYRLAPQSDEVATFMGMIALSSTQLVPEWIDLSLEALKKHRLQNIQNPSYLEILLDLAFAKGDEETLNWVVTHIDIKDIFAQPEMLPKLPGILMELKDKKWFKSVKLILDQLIEDKASQPKA